MAIVGSDSELCLEKHEWGGLLYENINYIKISTSKPHTFYMYIIVSHPYEMI